MKVRHLKEYLVKKGGGSVGQGLGGRNDLAHPLPLGVIEVIHVIS